MSASVKAHISEVCVDAGERLAEGPLRDAVAKVGAKLADPLTVTVAGGVSSGKSTLVNALLGQRIAAVDAGECTRVVTVFRYSHHERAEVELLDGTSRTLALSGGTLPSELGVPSEQVRQVVVHLSNAGLKNLGIVDTPGLNTVTTENQDQAVDFLGVGSERASNATAASVGQADALLFLMPHMRQSDAEVLAAFRDLYEGTGLSSFNSVAVLSKIDQLSRSGNPMDVARPIADRIATESRGLVSAVLPVVGLLAETSSTARLTEDDARALAVIARYGDDLDREDLLMSPQSFVDLDGPDVAGDVRRRLLDMAGIYGIQVALEVIDRGGRGAAPILRAFEVASGVAPLRELVIDRLGSQADLIKANNALCDLRRISYTPVSDPDDAVALRALRAPLDRIELDPTLHQLRVVQALHDAATGEFRLPGPLLEDLERLATGTDPLSRLGVATLEELGSAALDGAARWGKFANDPRRRPLDARRAREVKEAYEIVWAQHGRAGAS